MCQPLLNTILLCILSCGDKNHFFLNRDFPCLNESFFEYVELALENAMGLRRRRVMLDNSATLESCVSHRTN